MRYTEAKTGRIFIIRLEDGEKLPGDIEDFAARNNVLRGMCILIGGIKDGGNIVVGPEDGDVLPPVPMLFGLAGVHEVAGVGTLFPNKEGKPVLHMHAALGREGQTRAGCIRPGVEVWQVGEVILLELVDNTAQRLKDAATGFDLLEP
ncbi:MAG: DNA-binding protein [Dehalococcoidia bacterium]|nr:DNA-binding protein [Dehalococcoidia bacterium]